MGLRLLSLSTLASPSVKNASCRLRIVSPVSALMVTEGRRESKTHHHLSTTTTNTTTINTNTTTTTTINPTPPPRHHQLLQKSIAVNTPSIITPYLSRHLYTSAYSSSNAVIESASVGNGEVRVVWGRSSACGGEEEEWCVYPYPWLRDNCQCTQCYDAKSYTRIITLEDWHHDDTPHQVKVCEGGVCLEVVWSSGHISTFTSTWLHQRRFNHQARSVKKSMLALKKEIWGRDFQISRHSFDEIVSDDEALLGFLTSLEKFGVVLVTKAPRKPKAAFDIVNKAGFPKRTHYGLHYPIRRKLGAESLAFTDLKLGMHNDLPYYNYVCGIIFLHCITQFEGSGGENDLADGYHVSEYLRHHHPHQYHLLTHTPVYFWNKGVTEVEGETQEFYKLFNTPIIVEDSMTGEVVRVNNSQLRDSYLDISPELVTPWYSALRLFNTTLQQQAIRIKLNSGEMLVMDNTRLLHGRTAYDGAVGERYMDQVYLDWDQALSKRRVLQEKLGIHLE
ncbi:hypothetical protein Pcinc_015981 [Petrolisthes cinctipes]|uniref:Gamma-butyrobetaine dioxygenase n=1 Tax=Petrolisthes cinctipes TaxID=88211 RepID=A0AAE1FRZ1_PETCI|nr:hypothetical protein Pcinc_015981 [Petrolisthes cinctipes]